LFSSSGEFTIARIHYSGGGDWYADPSSLSNLLKFLNKNISIPIKKEEIVSIGDDLFYKNNYFYITGHGNIKLDKEEIVELREHLLNGAFLHVDDNYGLDKSFRKIIKEVFPDKELIELPINHEIFNIHYTFKNGLPKIHQHDNKRPQAFGIFDKEKLIVLYTYECDLGDGWEDANVHKVPEHKRESALKMGTNIILYYLLN
tara:strand:+ start:2562 stop:3167 length:606 start_codon:yes stop_codon:yes gene_type:complete